MIKGTQVIPRSQPPTVDKSSKANVLSTVSVYVPAAGANNVLYQTMAPGDGVILGVGLRVNITDRGVLLLDIRGASGNAMALEIPVENGVTELKEQIPVKKFDIITLYLAEVKSNENTPTFNGIGITFTIESKGR